MVWGRGKVGCEGELMCASATTMDKRKQDDHNDDCDDHGDDHDDDITMFCSVVCPCSSSSMPVVYICKTPFSLYTLATSTTLFVSLFVCCFVCCMSYVH